QPGGRQWLEEHARAINVTAVLLFTGVIAMAILRWSFESPLLMTFGLTWIALAYVSILLIAMTQHRHFLARGLRLRWLGAIGGLAYALYLFHQPVLGLTHLSLRRATPQLVDLYSLMVTLIALLLVFVVAKLSWICLEGPMVSRGHGHRYNRSHAE